MKATLLSIAAALLAVIGLAHSFLGERYVFRRLFQLADLPLLRNDRTYTERVLRYAWHLTSLAWWAFAALSLCLAYSPHNIRLLGVLLGMASILSGLLVLITVGTRHPAWWLFLIVGALTCFASW